MAKVSDWREKFDLPDLAFEVVQLAAYANANYARQRQSQTSVLSLSRTALATAIDLGDPQSPYDSIHPRRKAELGRLLAAAAYYYFYGEGEEGDATVRDYLFTEI